MQQATPYILEIDFTIDGPPIGDSGQRLPVTQTTTHRFDDLRSAFGHMMTIDLYRLDADFCRQKGVDSHFSKVCIRDEQREELVEMVCLRDHSRHFRVPEPGIYLCVLMGIAELEEAARIDLGELEYYHDAENYLLLANYNRSYDRLIPGSGYTELTAAIRDSLFVPTCPDPAAPYQLTIEGVHLSEGAPGDTQDSGEFLLEQRYPTLREAFEKLISLEVRQFHASVADRHNLQQYYDDATIKHTPTNETIVTVYHIGFGESPGGLPTAGIYLRFPQGMDKFQQETGLKFDGIDGYDPGVPHLLTAAYRYDEQGHNIIPSPSFVAFTHKLANDEELMSPPEKNWNYFLEIQARHHSHSAREPGKASYQHQYYAFHYERLDEALHSLLSVDFYKLDEGLCRSHDLKTFVTSAVVHDREGNKMAALAAVNKTSVAPGIYLQVPVGFQQLQQDEGIDLSLLRYQDLEFSRQLPGTDLQQPIAVYTNDNEHLLINEGVALGKDWLLEHPQDQGQSPSNENEPMRTSTAQPDPTAEKMPFSLRILWNSSPAQGEGHYIEPTPVVAHFPDFASAFGALQECEPHFRPPGNLPAGYINHASILDNGDGGEILRKFAPPPQSAEDIDGTCIQLNQSKINLDILKTIREHFVAVGEPEAIHHLVYRSRKKNAAAQASLSRQPPHTSREIKDLPGKGMNR